MVQVVTHAGNKQGEDLNVPEGEAEKRNVTLSFLLGTSEKTAGREAQGPPSRELPQHSFGVPQAWGNQVHHSLRLSSPLAEGGAVWRALLSKEDLKPSWASWLAGVERTATYSR